MEYGRERVDSEDSIIRYLSEMIESCAINE